MIGLEDRQALARDIHSAHAAGARLKPACAMAGIDLRTLQRWQAMDGLVSGDRRPQAIRPILSHALSEAERAHLLAVANEPRFSAMPPARIVPMLADEGIYLASESTFSRVLKAHGQTTRRGRAKAPKASRPPTTHIATEPRQVWCWDMTYLPAQVMGRWFYLYLILDLYNRKIVGWEVHNTDHADHAAHLVRRTALAEGIATLSSKPVLHGDNGATLKATTVLAMLNWLGVKPSYSRPRVSDDNEAVVYVPNAIPEGDGLQGLQALGTAGQVASLSLAELGASPNAARTSVALFDQGLLQVLQASVTGLRPKSPYMLALADKSNGGGTLQPLANFMTNPAGAAIVNTIGPIRQIVQADAPATRRFLVVAPVVDGKPSQPVQVQLPAN